MEERELLGSDTSDVSGPLFERSVICLCARGVWQRAKVNTLLWILVIGIALSGLVVGGVYLGNFPTISTPYQGVRNAWLGLTITSFVISLLLSLYPGRWLSGYQTGIDKDYSHIFCTYIVGSIWVIQVIVGVGFALHYGDVNDGYIANDGLIMTATSMFFAIILGFMNIVFNPIIPLWLQACGFRHPELGLTEVSSSYRSYLNNYSSFVKFFLQYGIIDGYNNACADGQISMMIIFCVSVFLMNVTMAVSIFDHVNYLGWAIAPSLIGAVLSVILFGLIHLAASMLSDEDYRRIGHGDFCCLKAWGLILFSIYSVVSIVCFFVYLPYDSQPMNTKSSLFVAQGGIVLSLWVLAGMIIMFRNCYCREEWNRAMEQVQNDRMRDRGERQNLIDTE